MDLVTVIFWIIAVILVGSALLVVTQRNIVHSALALVVVFAMAAGIYLLLNAEFIAIVQILIYAGAIMVLFLFVVTMFASEASDTELQDRIPWQRWVAGILGLVLVGALSYLLFTGTAIDSSAIATGGSLSHVVNTQGNIEAFGLALFHGFAFPFEVTSLLIVVALLGALVLGRKA